MREGFREIANGWELLDRDDLNERIARLALWVARNRETAGDKRDEWPAVVQMIERIDGDDAAVDRLIGQYLRCAGIPSVTVSDNPRPLPELDSPDPWDVYRETFGRGFGK